VQKLRIKPSKSDSIDANQLRQLVGPLASDHRLLGEASGPMLKGHFFSRRFGADMSVHCVDAHELEDRASSSECPAGISINILLAGAVQFSLGAQQYECRADDRPLGFGLRLVERELFTRQLRRGAYVCKVNVSLSEAWVRERFDGALPDIGVSTARQQPVVSWQPDEPQLLLAHKLLRLSVGAEASAEAKTKTQAMISMEAAAIELVGRVLHGEGKSEPLAANSANRAADALRQLLERDLAGTLGLTALDLTSLAHRAGMSVSTLQRRFKSECGMTVMEYVRQRKLEMARNALVVKGRSLQEAAFLAGYEHSSNFISAFKRRFGVTPANLVRQHRADL
jgi:AraC-like DNA-binding protein